ncbi:MAG: NADH-quinone oxidoreductase subunit NuoE [Leptospiraceae bacterium]|nr:NADH-quinone oxidoreductase subunit NuoE [Leptospiraceae bacterium]MCK6380485.1 NADH-quinone oxidoreductase subunit NuoE [Leptospiraceae bacterium]NUM42150.1 NADH-quinone oxidoreductase subunit NuoE [Leptospiraceae bacterium]
MGFQFGSESEKRFEKLRTMFPDKRSLILPGLHLIQKEKGFVDQEAMEYLTKKIGEPIKLSEVYGVATFYTMYNKKPVGKYHIQICSNISCYITGSDSVTSHICGKLGIEEGETTKDKKFTLSEVQCLGACGYGPMMQINEEYYEFLTPEKIDQILDSLE